MAQVRQRRDGIDSLHARRRANAARANADVRRKERELRHSFWRLVLQGAVGAAVLIGLAFTWLQLSDARTVASRQQDATTQQLRAIESGQITDQFSRAIDRLGNQDAPDVRIGGVYALERIAGDSERDRQTVAEVLSSFVVRASAARDPNRKGNRPRWLVSFAW